MSVKTEMNINIKLDLVCLNGQLINNNIKEQILVRIEEVLRENQLLPDHFEGYCDDLHVN